MRCQADLPSRPNSRIFRLRFGKQHVALRFARRIRIRASLTLSGHAPRYVTMLRPIRGDDGARVAESLRRYLLVIQAHEGKAKDYANLRATFVSSLSKYPPRAIASSGIADTGAILDQLRHRLAREYNALARYQLPEECRIILMTIDFAACQPRLIKCSRRDEISIFLIISGAVVPSALNCAGFISFPRRPAPRPPARFGGAPRRLPRRHGDESMMRAAISISNISIAERIWHINRL